MRDVWSEYSTDLVSSSLNPGSDALKEKAQLVGIDDENGINVCKLVGLGFTTALAILVRSQEKALIDSNDALAKLDALARSGRYKDSIVDDARMKLEAQK